MSKIEQIAAKEREVIAAANAYDMKRYRAAMKELDVIREELGIDEEEYQMQLIAMGQAKH
jgi:hypothetical protein